MSRGFNMGYLLGLGYTPKEHNLYYLWGFFLGQMDRAKLEIQISMESDEEKLAMSPLWPMVRDHINSKG